MQRFSSDVHSYARGIFRTPDLSLSVFDASFNRVFKPLVCYKNEMYEMSLCARVKCKRVDGSNRRHQTRSTPPASTEGPESGKWKKADCVHLRSSRPRTTF